MPPNQPTQPSITAEELAAQLGIHVTAAYRRMCMERNASQRDRLREWVKAHYAEGVRASDLREAYYAETGILRGSATFAGLVVTLKRRGEL